MVIEVFLPKPYASFLLIDVPSLLFETLGKYKKIASRCLSKGQEMKVVRHYAIGVHQEQVQMRFDPQELGNPFGSISVEKNWLTMLAAHGDEGPLFADVFLKI